MKLFPDDTFLEISSNWPTGPIQSSSRDVRVSVCLFDPLGKVLERSGLIVEHFCWDVV